ncbi:MAG: VPLPA-CTERM sorting domain-containing protein [Pseudomonadota bacterium]
MASAVPLTFDNPLTAVTGSTPIGGTNGVVENTVVEFANVGMDGTTTVDARVTATVKTDTTFGNGGGSFGDSGYIVDYASSGAPDKDLAFLFYGNNLNQVENGISLKFEFFDGTGAASGTFGTALTVSELNFAVYDVDGETAGLGTSSTQSEFFRAFLGDGLTSYSVGSTPQALSVDTSVTGEVRFNGPGTNFSETDATGAAILTYQNTSMFTLDFGAVMTVGNDPNPVFTGFDGDLSLFNPDEFDDPIATVPLPAGLPLLLAGLGALGLARRFKR